MAVKLFSLFMLCCIPSTLRVLGNEFLIDRDLIQKRDGFKFNFQDGRGEVKGTGFRNVGCWKDSWDRAIEPLEGKHELLQDTNYKLREDPLRKCAIASLDNHLQMFAIENGGQCLGDKTAVSLYQRFGPANGCKDDGYGGPWSMQVYSFTGFEVKPRHGRYTKWSSWTKCSKTCGKGIKKRSRSCTHPRPANGGMDCRRFGPSTKTKSCTNECMGEETENLNEPLQSLSPITQTFMSPKVSSFTNSTQSADNTAHKKNDLDDYEDDDKDTNDDKDDEEEDKDEDDNDDDDNDNDTSTSKGQTKSSHNHVKSNNEMGESTSDITNSTNDIGKSTNDMTKSTNDMTKSNNMKKSTNDITKSATNDMTQSTNDMTKSTNDMTKSSSDMAKPTNNIGKSTNDMAKSTNDMAKSINDMAKFTNKMPKSTNDMAKSTNNHATNHVGKYTNNIQTSNGITTPTENTEIDDERQDKMWDNKIKAAHDLLRARWLSLARHPLRVSPKRDENSASRHDVTVDASLREDEVNNDNDDLDEETDDEEKKNGKMDEKTEKIGDEVEGMDISATKRITEECICPAVMCLHLADTGVLIDNSNVTEIADLAEMKSFAKGLAAGFGTKEKDIQMGIIAAGMRSRIVVPFHETLPLHDVDRRVDGIEQENGSSALGEAFKRAEAYLLAKQKKAIPPLLNDVLFVMASGDSDVDVHAPVKDLKAGGAKIVVIGVGKNAKLGKVASSADKVFMVPPGAGNAMVNAIISAVCQTDLMGKVNPNPKPCPCMLNPGTKKRTSTELFAARNTPYSPPREFQTESSSEQKPPEVIAHKEIQEATGTPLHPLEQPPITKPATGMINNTTLQKIPPETTPSTQPANPPKSPSLTSPAAQPATSPVSPPLASHGSPPAASQGLPAFSPKNSSEKTAPPSTPVMPPAVLPVRPTSQQANLNQNSVSQHKVIHLTSQNIKPLSASLSALSESLNKAQSAGELKEGNITLTNDIQNLLKHIASLKKQADDLRSSGKESEIEQSDARPVVGQSALNPKVSSQSTPSPKVSSQSTSSPINGSQSTPLSPKVTSQSTLSPKVTSQSILSPKVTSQSILSPKVTSQSTLSPKVTSQSTLSPKANGQLISQEKQSLEIIAKADNGQPTATSNVPARQNNSLNKIPTQSKKNIKQADLHSDNYAATHNARRPLAIRISHDAPLPKQNSNAEEAKISKPNSGNSAPSKQRHPEPIISQNANLQQPSQISQNSMHSQHDSISQNDVTHWPEKITSTSATTVQNSKATQDPNSKENFFKIESDLSKHSGTPATKPNPSIPDCDINLGFVLDGSASVEGTKRENFLKMINFVKDTIHEFTVLSRQVHVGTLVYSTNTSVILTFGTKGTEEMIDRLLDNVRYPGQGSLTGNALKESWNSMFSSVPRGRKSKLLLLTDGPSNDDIAGPSKWIKDSGVELFAIGLGTAYDEKQLNIIASGPTEQHVMIKQYDELKTSVQEVRNKVCGFSADQIIQLMNSASYHNDELTAAQKQFKPNQCILDVAFLLDGSRQVETNGEGNFQRQIDFVKKAAKYLPISRDDVHMGVGLLGDSDVMVFPMNEHYTESAVNFELDHIQYPASSIIQLEQLQSARDIMLRRGIRDVAPHVFVLVTDVSSLDFYRRSVDQMRSEGTEVVLFGIGSISWEQEVKVRSSVEGLVNQVVTVQSGDEEQAVKQLAENLCKLSNEKRSDIPRQRWKYSKKVLNSKL